MRIGAGKSAEIAALAEGGAGDKEAHIGRLWHLLRLRGPARTERQQRRQCEHGRTQFLVHRNPPFFAATARSGK